MQILVIAQRVDSNRDGKELLCSTYSIFKTAPVEIPNKLDVSEV